MAGDSGPDIFSPITTIVSFPSQPSTEAWKFMAERGSRSKSMTRFGYTQLMFGSMSTTSFANDPLRKSLARIAWLANSVRVRPSTSSWEPPYRIVMVELPQDRIRQAETLKLPTPDLDSFICCKELPIAGIGAVPFG